MDKSSGSINSKYKKFRKLLKSWSSDKKISWSNIQRYLSKKTNYIKFLDHNGIENTHTNKKIIFDILEDFLISESLEWGSMFEHEKILADYFDVSLSYIKIIDPDIYLFEVNSLGNNLQVILLTPDDQLSVEDQVWNYFFDQISQKNISINATPEQSNIYIEESFENLPNSKFLLNSEALRELFLKEIRKSPRNIVEWLLFLSKKSNKLNILSTKVIDQGIISKVG